MVTVFSSGSFMSTGSHLEQPPPLALSLSLSPNRPDSHLPVLHCATSCTPTTLYGCHGDRTVFWSMTGSTWTSCGVSEFAQGASFVLPSRVFRRATSAPTHTHSGGTGGALAGHYNLYNSTHVRLRRLQTTCTTHTRLSSWASFGVIKMRKDKIILY